MIINKEELEDLIFNQKLSYEEIGRMNGCSGNAIKKRAKKLGIILPKRRKINEKESFNKGRQKEKYCLNCDNDISGSRNKYCNLECFNNHRKTKVYEQIENGNTTLHYKNYKNYLIDKYGNNCMLCGWGEINPYTNTIPIELEHMDGDSSNNSIDNLTLLCPNCHSLTETYKGANRGNGRHYRRERYKEGKSF